METESGLDKIGLEKVTLEQYKQWAEWWDGELKYYKATTYARIHNPISVLIEKEDQSKRRESYAELFKMLFYDKNVFRINIDVNGRWRRLEKTEQGYITYDMDDHGNAKVKPISHLNSDPEFEQMVKTAESHRYHYNYFEIVLGFYGSKRWRPHISFAEYPIKDQIRITGYHIKSKRRDLKLFPRVKKIVAGKHVEAIWIPPGYKELPSPVSMRAKQ